ncbi:MAG: putative biotin ligase [Methanonatronarchaeales archaeon]|nr:putative biotin ligase [Methanonatronarchaeales archaeon]
MSNRGRIFELLDREEVISGEAIGELLGISRAAVWKHVEALREDGYEILSSDEGYLLKGFSGEMNELEIERRLDTEVIGGDVVVLGTTASTNEELKSLAAEGAAEGTVVVARRQVEGKGRIGKRWESPEGGLYLSVLLRPRMAPTEAQKMTLLAGLAVARALRGLGVDARIKWSNDVVIDGKKVCGVLTEMSAEENAVDYIVIGIGINANTDPGELPEEIRDDSAILRDELGGEIDLRELAASLLEEFDELYVGTQDGNFEEVLTGWKELSETLGREVLIETRRDRFVGYAVGLSRDGALVVELPDGDFRRVTGGLCRHLDSY